jgi:hypothetical protein
MGILEPIIISDLKLPRGTGTSWMWCDFFYLLQFTDEAEFLEII